MNILYRSVTCLKVVVTTLFISVLFVASAQPRLKQDSITVAIEPSYDSVSATHRLFFGKNYRKLWATPVKIKVFHLNKEKGGLKILQKGGGMQTKSLRLEDGTGQQWVLRTIQKYPESVLPASLRPTIAAAIVQDQISAEHPFAALVVPPLAKALSIPHANPQVVYVPDDPAFGKYQNNFKNQVFLFEEREPTDADKTDNTDKAQKKLEKDNDNRVDQKLVLRARLLDFLLGDWDRHSDQWRWKQIEDSTGTLYEPIPRDRDQVFYGPDGILPTLVSHHLMFEKFQDYGNHIRAINRWNLNARNFDRYFLTQLSEQDWEEQIKYVQKTLTDNIIRNATKAMPPEIYRISGNEITRRLIARKNGLRKQALSYYRFISQKVQVAGTKKRERFDITNEPEGKLNVTVRKIKKDGSAGKIIYQRTFDPDVTNEVRLFGLDGEDVFAVHGTQSSPIKVRMIGGNDEDTFTVDSTLHGKGKRFVYDRSDEKNNIPTRGARIRTSIDTIVNNFDSGHFKYDYFQPLIYGSYNKDYGVQFIGDFILEKQGFRKDPYGYRQSLMVNYGFGATSLLLNYNGVFKQALGKNDLVINVLSKGPNYKSNFFGIGNESVYANDYGRDIHYYRNVYNYLDANIGIRRYINKWTISAGLTGQYYNGDEDDNVAKFLKVYSDQHPVENVFSKQIYAGATASFELDTRDKSVIPHKGIDWNTSLIGIAGLKQNEHAYGQITSEFSFYLTPGTDSVFVIANRTGAGTTLGSPAYFQQLKLGGNSNLRGFYNWRFTGKTIAYNNFEVRLKLFDFASYLLPGTLGVVGFNDVGRVWSPGEKSNVWHDGYGGGLYFIPAQLLLIQGVVGFSKEGAYPYISAGFRF